MPPCNVDPDGNAASEQPCPASLDGPPTPTSSPALTCAFTVSAQLAAAWLARSRIRNWLESLALPPALVDDVEYMTSEAVSNAAEHAYPPEAVDGTIDVAADVVTLDSRRLRIRVTVRDHGRWQPVNPDPGHRGHGLAAMVALAAELTIRHHDVTGGGTEITLLSAVTSPVASPTRPVQA